MADQNDDPEKLAELARLAQKKADELRKQAAAAKKRARGSSSSSGGSNKRAKVDGETQNVPQYGAQVIRRKYDMLKFLAMDADEFAADLGPEPDREQLRVGVVFEDEYELWFTTDRKNIYDRLDVIIQSGKLKDHGPATILKVHQTRVTKPQGSGKPMPPPKNMQEAIRKTSVVAIRNKDQLCFDRSLAVLFHRDWMQENLPAWKKLIDHRLVLQGRLAREIRQKVGIPEDRGISIDDIPLYEDTYKVDIRVWALRALGPSQVYGPKAGNECRYGKAQDALHILCHDNHYCPVLNIGHVLGHSFWDAELEVAASKPKLCYCCKSLSCPDKDLLSAQGAQMHCGDCNRKFKSQACFDIHKSLTLGALRHKPRLMTTCAKYLHCKDCRKTEERFSGPPDAYDPAVWTQIDEYNWEQKRPGNRWPIQHHIHRCGHVACKACGLYCFIQDHVCFVKQPPLEPKAVGDLYFYDLETRADTPAHRHVVNWVEVQSEEGEKHTFCDIEGFLGFAMTRNPGSIFFAHNASKFDSAFILEHILQCTDDVPMVLRQNGRILSLVYKKIKFQDSYPHISCGLAKFPKMFGLDAGPKGFFPHRFNTLANQEYVGEMPPLEYYSPDTMRSQARAELIEWHKEQVASNTVFDFKKEMEKYCEQDVTLLRLGVLAYRKILIDNCSGYDPLGKLTIAAVGHDLFMRQHMPEDSIENLARTYTRKDSAEEREYVSWLEHKLNYPLKRQFKVNQYSVDAYDPKTHTAYEYNGCCWHGGYNCSICRMNPHAINPVNKKSMYKMALETASREASIKDLGFNVNTMSSCEYKQLARTDPKHKAFSKEYKKVSPIEKRDALFGGRTDLMRMYWTARVAVLKASTPEEQAQAMARYVDFTSLYPAMLKYRDLPQGPHYKTQGPEAQKLNLRALIDTGELGIVKADVFAPLNLRCAVLPIHEPETGKLIFPVGPKSGTWTTVELELALEMGYTCERIHEAWMYKEKGRVFSGYIDTFLKLKQEASGKPAWVKTEADLDRYIREFEAHEGIKLDKDRISKNPGIRAVAKLYLNSLWGKFCQRETHLMTETHITNQPLNFFQTLDNPCYAWESGQSNFEFTGAPGREKVYFQLQKHEDLAQGNCPNTNEILGSFVTAHARCALYRLLRDIGFEHVLYMDTDSAIYVETPENAWIHRPTSEGGKLGDYLGELTNELEGDNEYITEYVALAPKTYAYRTSLGNEVVKSKGFELNHQNSLTINFDGYKAKLFEEKSSKRVKLQTTTDALRKAPATTNFNIHTRIESKEIKSLYNKGTVLSDWSVRPFNYEGL